MPPRLMSTTYAACPLCTRRPAGIGIRLCPLCRGAAAVRLGPLADQHGAQATAHALRIGLEEAIDEANRTGEEPLVAIADYADEARQAGFLTRDITVNINHHPPEPVIVPVPIDRHHRG